MAKNNLSLDQKLELIEDIFTRGVGEFFDPDNSFRKKLVAKAEGKYKNPIIVKFGVDPTRPDIHLGHAVCFRKLRKLQMLGCKVIFLVGDFTATIGDPTGKNKARPALERQVVVENAKTYLQQIGKLVEVGDLSDSDNFSWIVNSDWLLSVGDIAPTNENLRAVIYDGESEIIKSGSQSYPVRAALWSESRMQKSYLGRDEILEVALNGLMFTLQHITHSRLIERDMFQERIKNNEPLFMHEMLYPVFQGLDSFALAKIYGSCDLEVGGTDQTFNMIVGRDVMSANHQESQSVLAFKLLVGIDGKEKMSKSLDNYIGITDEPNEIFGKTMSIPDTSLVNYFELATEVPMSEIETIKKELEGEEVNPRDLKVRLAKEIVTLYHGTEAGARAEQYFINTFSKGQLPQEAEPSQGPPETLAAFVANQGGEYAKSKSDARRKIEQGGVKIDGVKITDPNYQVSHADNGKMLQVGPRFRKIVFLD